MYLSRVEMTGFKSFAEKTVIEFDKGMTAVVGPNGSGKSNLSEAIRWVLGEQSAKSLRGSKMEDVIFNGTQDRKAVNLAKVTLVLNNEDRYLDYDFNEIAITRSYNRNGDSNYFINKEPVRLKDIVDLLLDSGLGKNSFAMISQGKVEAIFLNKPEERRAIFEEAAGVQKYQFRKVEAERKLNKSADHLSRVKDIIHELDQQLKPLGQQREAALIYQEKQAQLKQLEISLYVYQIAIFQVDWEQSKVDFAAVQREMNQFEEAINSLELTLLEAQKQLDQMVNQIDQLAEQTQAQATELERKKAKREMLQQALVYHQGSKAEKDQQHQIDCADLKHKQAKLALLVQKHKDQQAELSTLQQAYQQTDKSRASLMQNQLANTETIRQQLIEAYQVEATANNQIRQAELQETRYQKQIETIQTKQGEVKEKLSDFDESFQPILAAYQALADQPHHLNQQVNKLQQENQQLQAERQQLDQAIFNQTRQNQMKEARLQSLHQQQEEYAGYYGGVQAVMRQPQLKGIFGPVGDLIRVPDSLQLAIDTALGGALQYIVVKDDESARHAIRYLKEARAGRATFLPLSNIRPRQLSPQLVQQVAKADGVIGLASELIEYDQVYDSIIANLLATTVVCQTLIQAQQLAKASRQQLRIVTLDGDILMPGGALTGGHTKKQGHTLLNRQQDLKQLQLEFQEGQVVLASLEQDRQKLLDNLADLDHKLQTLTLQQADQQTRDQSIRQAYQDGQHNLKQLQQQAIIYQDEQLQLEEGLNQYKLEMAQAYQDLELAQQSISQLKLELEGANLSGEERAKQVSQLEMQLAELNTQQAVKSIEVKQLKTEISQLEQAINLLEQAVQRYQANQDESELSLTEMQGQIEALSNNIQSAQNQLDANQSHLSSLKEQRTIKQQEQRDQDKNLQALRQTYQESYQRSAKLQASCEKYESFIDSHLTYLNETYQLSFEAAQQQAIDLKDQHQSVNQQVKQLKREIERLGPINLAAIDDYEQLDLRYQNLKEQETDLLTAMAQLKSTMSEMEEEVTKRFSHTFHQINQQFQLTFRKLFGGGQAALTLTQPDNLLTTGVDIVAQPPGKRKQNLALLSGGERAFTAIALLFAILETKPVPFCVLDEVEAALDDANVYRYGQYLQSFTQQTQFIVITHRKGTMEHADVLYGVTMQQSGVSKLASVRLSEAEEKA